VIRISSLSIRSNGKGLTLVELLCALTLMALMAAVAMPVAHVMHRRAKELELKQHLRTMRRAIDSYHQVILMVPGAKQNASATDEDWPEDLDVLVEGLDLGLAKEVKAKFLRRIPVDPLTGEAEWGKRSNKQDEDDDLWDSQNVFDVFSLAEGKALDGTEYKTW